MPATDRRLQPLDTWERILARMADARREPSPEGQIRILMEIMISLRLLGQEEGFADRRQDGGNIEDTYRLIQEEVRRSLRAVQHPSGQYVFYFREILKRLPIRQGGHDLIEDIRAAAEEFEERRSSDDPLLPFAGDLRKEVHRRLSPRILASYLIPYLRLVEDGDPQPMVAAGYGAAARTYTPGREDPACLNAARELQEKLGYLWDYEAGDVYTIRIGLQANLPLFERCFLRREVEAFLELLTPANLRDRHVVLDMLRRLISFKYFLKKSYAESRIELLEFLNVDLDLGRLIFIFENDLTNRHYREVTLSTLGDALGVARELLTMMQIREFAIGDYQRFFADIDELRGSEDVDPVKVKRCLLSIGAALQRYLHDEIYSPLGLALNEVLESWHISTARQARVKDRFFNNLVRRTCFHVLSEFIEAILAALDRELAIRRIETNLYGRYAPGEVPRLRGRMEDFIAASWEEVAPELRQYLGGKGNSLVDMSRLGLRVPPAIILGLPLCQSLLEPEQEEGPLKQAVFRRLRDLEQKAGKRLGDASDPLLVAVRAGAVLSMPGAMLTVLNCGIVGAVADALGHRFGPQVADEIHLRFLRQCLTGLGVRPGRTDESPASEIRRARALLLERLGSDFFADPFEQVYQVVRLVAQSSRSAGVLDTLRELSIEQKRGTAVTVQQMVFGNVNAASCSGVLLTRHPVTGADELYGEYKERVQGVEVVGGEVIPSPISELPQALQDELRAAKRILERHFSHELDIEFTVEDNRLYLLQARRATLSPYAELVVDLDFLAEGLIDAQQFKLRLERLATLHDWVSIPRAGGAPGQWKPPISRGVPVRNGVVCGLLLLNPERLEEMAREKDNLVFLAWATQPSDFRTINRCQAIVTVHPGRTSHAAITAMTLNKPCVVGCTNAHIDLDQRRVRFRNGPDVVVREGERITVDANTGAIYQGTVALSDSFIRVSELYERVRDIDAPQEILQSARSLIAEKVDAVGRQTGYEKASLRTCHPGTLAGRTVLVRLDFNVPMQDGQIADPSRIELAVPTLRAILDAGGTPVVCSHLGDPGIEEEGRSREQVYQAYSLRPASEFLEQFFPRQVHFLEMSVASSGLLVQKEDLAPGRINILENVRFALGEKENDPVFARSLAGLADGIYVNDAFGVCHRRHASITGVPPFLSMRLAGLLVEKELHYLGHVLSHPQRPLVALIGGANLTARLGMIESILPRLDAIAASGELARCLLDPVAKDAPLSEHCRQVFERSAARVVLPVDWVGEASGDPGPRSISQMLDLAREAATILWNGLLGEEGTRLMARELASLAGAGKIVIVTGKQTVRAVQSVGAAERITHLSTGDEAATEFIELMTLPGIACLDPRPRLRPDD